jgi:predicted dinucleotide-binding enzyme
MKIGILGTGMVGKTIGAKLAQLGHEVKYGGRTAKDGNVTFADAATFGEIVFNCTKGDVSVAVTESAKSALKGKILIDVTNPLDFSKGMPPTLFAGNTDSLGEKIQSALPDTKVVKALNTINCNVMVEPSRIKGDHDVFVSGNDKEAKARVAEILKGWFGWKNVIDLGDITTSRGTESYMPLWLRLWGALGTADFNIKIVR